MARGYIPQAGDLTWLQFDPQAGHEQSGHRPAVVLSPASYNGRAGMIVCCPTTTRIKGLSVRGHAGWNPAQRSARRSGRKPGLARPQGNPQGRVSSAELAEVRAKLAALIA